MAFGAFIAVLAVVGDAILRCDKLHGVPAKTLGTKAANIATSIVSVLFFNWGFIYGLLDVMNSHVREALDLSGPAGTALAISYYLTYFWGPLLFSGPIIKKFGYRISFIIGLSLVAVGCFWFAFAARKERFYLMVIGMHISGLGVSTLERGANPYATNIGPKSSRTMRILFAQSMAGVGTVVAPLVARAMLYGDDPASLTIVVARSSASRPARPDLGRTIKLYNLVGFVTLGLVVLYAVVFFRTRWVPEIPVGSSPPYTHGWKVWKHEIFSMRYLRLWTGCISNFFNMACQVTIAQFFIDYLEIAAHQSRAMATTYLSVAQALFVVGRLASFGMVSISLLKPRYVLLGYITGAIAASVICIFVSGTAAIAFPCLAMFWEAPSFPMNFDAATVGLGPWASTSETMMIVSISGGAMGPILFAVLKDAVGISKAWSLVAACFAIVWAFPFLCNIIPSWKRAVDLEEENTSAAGVQLKMMETRSAQVSEREVTTE